MKFYLIFLALLFCSPSLIFAQLTPDSTFQNTGYKFIAPSFSVLKNSTRIYELSDGSTLLTSGENNKLQLYKLLPNGNIDMTFGTNGIATNALLDNEDGTLNNVQDIDILTDNRIILLVKNELFQSPLDNTLNKITLVSFMPDGSVDYSFNSIGYLITRPDTAYQFKSMALAIDKRENKNEIYVGSFVYENNHFTCPIGFGKWCISKYKANGAKDISFNTNGYLLSSSNAIKPNSQSPMAIINDMRFMPSGYLQIAGSLNNVDASYFAMRILPNGHFDSSFNNIGTKYYPVNYIVPTNELTNAQVLKDGSCVFHSILTYSAGSSAGFDSSDLRILKTNVNGNIDNTFGNAGLLHDYYLSAQYPILAFKSNNSFMLIYYKKMFPQNSNQKVEFKYYNAQGVLDQSFGINGTHSTQILNPDTYVNPSWFKHAIWDKTETKIYAICPHQPYNATGYINSAVYRYSWKGTSPLSINENNVSNTIKAFPNPVSSELSLNPVSKEDKITMYSLNGQVIPIEREEIANATATIHLPIDISNGIYFVFIENKIQKEVLKINVSK